jgi:hypothetical protein
MPNEVGVGTRESTGELRVSGFFLPADDDAEDEGPVRKFIKQLKFLFDRFTGKMRFIRALVYEVNHFGLRLLIPLLFSLYLLIIMVHIYFYT